MSVYRVTVYESGIFRREKSPDHPYMYSYHQSISDAICSAMYYISESSEQLCSHLYNTEEISITPSMFIDELNSCVRLVCDGDYPTLAREGTIFERMQEMEIEYEETTIRVAFSLNEGDIGFTITTDDIDTLEE